MSTLLVENINKSFGKFQAVKDLSFSIDEGTMFGLLGPNGAGKTTTIRMIMDIIIPDSGRITVMGNDKPKVANDFIGYLPEERGLYRKMKVGELLLFMAELKSMKRREAKNEINAWLERLDLMEWKNKKVEDLSKGMQQKLQFIGTILHKPKLLILDEPFMGLDPINTDIVRNIMIELKDNGATIIFSTHLMENAEKLCEQIILIDHGEKILDGNLKDIKNKFGRMNLVIEFEGKDSFLKESKQIKSYDNFGNYVEIQMVENGDTQELLRDAMKSAEIRKFELVLPSLHEIFVETVQKPGK